MFGLREEVTACLFDMDGVGTHTAVVPAGRAVAFEDALAGVEAGRAGHFALVVGADRVGQAAELRKHGADVVEQDVAELLGQDGPPGHGAR
jgi:beta-phosphoglucomutase-like phosphatase (HAD superfamily)